MQKIIANKVKQASVAVGLYEDKVPQCPFVIFGSGFCIDASGLIVTCRHVLDCFNKKSFSEMVSRLPPSEKPQQIPNFQAARPFVFFFNSRLSTENLIVIPVPVETGMALMDFDLGVCRISNHAAFRGNYPTLDLANYEDLYEGMEIGTCGFPLGDGLRDQIGTIASSFTFGRLSSIIPSENVPIDYLKGFQLDITVTHGNSGGPVYDIATGRVLGVLQRGVMDNSGKMLPGIAKAEPIFPILRDEGRILTRLKTITEGEIKDGKI